ncbi:MULTISPECIES: MGMT family protein [Flavobacterium]|uniref:MGMT family protein n=2 Tax=Flavobacterium TaxID=237 RepID=A0A2N9P8L6_9FLAO|nr:MULTISPECIES: MGMT family protein [Flavobacterium]OWP84005.1 cysteine methyltransferase [Flavobacterium davisii]QYS88105.1 MGMT family protein [Flavobacterium davisii]RVU90779.1 MGMT family protein [Flavobacterium columnare]SPE76669.1 Methylated-DNA--protein-cysteine methyltransferase, constitutive [Flavobacterium columnare]
MVVAKTFDQNFFERVYEIVRQIPYGKVTSYGAIARALGTARSARMVGWAMNACHDMNDVPAHRVVNRNGVLTGKHHFEGSSLMQQLLENEGIKVMNNQIIDFKKHFWEPSIKS